jgi:hypothetical protein
MLFLVFLLLVLISVASIGRLIYLEALKNEAGKRNVEVWSGWLEKAGNDRFNQDFEPNACAGSDKAQGKSWADCLSMLMTPPHPLANTRNPFTQQGIGFTSKCDPGNRSLAGSLVIEKILPTTPGSPTPFYTSPLVKSDTIDQKMQLRLTACDQGAYPGRPTEVAF